MNEATLTDKSLDEERDGDDVEHEEVEDVLAVLLEEGGEAVPLAPHPRALALVHARVHLEARHPAQTRHSSISHQLSIVLVIHLSVNLSCYFSYTRKSSN